MRNLLLASVFALAATAAGAQTPVTKASIPGVRRLITEL